MNLDVIKLLNISNINIPLWEHSKEFRFDCTLQNYGWKDARIQVTFLNLIHNTPMYREYISLINGFMMHSYMIMVKAL